MKKLLIIIFLFIFFRINAQSTIPSLNKCKFENEISKNKYTLVVVSSAMCGYCEIALKELNKSKELNKINIIIYEYDGNNRNEKKFSNFYFIDANKCDISQYTDDFFPVFYLYENNKLIWTKEGWYKKNIKKITSKIKNH